VDAVIARPARDTLPPLRFGLVGTGHWAQVTHAPAIAAAPGATFVGVWGRRPEAATALAGSHGVRAFSDVDALFDEVDAVAFCVPPDVQATMAIRAARSGKHLLLDKPIALTLAAGDTLAETVDAAGVRSLVFFTGRFQPDVRAWLADIGSTADWDGATAHWLGNASQPSVGG
jgi:predicted dehydrogenase